MGKAIVYDIESFPNLFSFVAIETIFVKNLNDFKKLDISTKDKSEVINYFINVLNGKIIVLQNDMSKVELVNYLTDLKNYVELQTLILGYNNLKYDDILLFYIISNYHKYISMIKNDLISDVLLDINQASSNIINSDFYIPIKEKKIYWAYKPKPNSIDLQKINHLDVSMTSLKHCQIILKWHNVKEFDLPPISEIDAHYYFHREYTKDDKVIIFNLSELPELWDDFKLDIWERHIPTEYINDVVYYNINDTMSTLALFEYSKDEIKQRANITNTYNINVLSLSRSATGEKLINKFYTEKTGEKYKDIIDRKSEDPIVYLKDVIDEKVNFKTKEFNELLNELKKHIVYIHPPFKKTIIFDGCKYNVALGGLHTIDRPGIFKSTDDYTYRDADAESYYPTTIINNKLVARQFSKEEFLNLYIDLRDRRLYAKHNKYKDGVLNPDLDIENEALKIVLNGVYGKSNEPKSILYDPSVTYGVTINNQLYLLSLVEMFYEAGIKTISVNTDGVVCKVYKHQEDDYYKVCKQWENYYNQSLEYNDYLKYIRLDVNNYMSITAKGKIKTKGRFSYSIDLAKGYIFPIVAITVQEYYKNNINIKEFLRNHNDILDFCAAVKVGSQFEVQSHYLSNGNLIIKKLQKNNRYFISNKGVTLYKQYKDKSKKVSLVSGEYCTVLNELEIKDDYDIKYSFYIKLIMDIINRVSKAVVPIVHKKTTMSGTMFDEIE